MRPAAIGVGGVVVVAATSAQAASSFVYEAPSVCPTRAHVEEAVSARTSVPIPDTATMRIVVSSNGFVGTLELDEATRRLALDRCDELVDALALSLALQLERSLSTPEPAAAVASPVSPKTSSPAPPPPSTAPRQAARAPFARLEGGLTMRAWWGRGRSVRPEPSVFVAVERVDGWWSMRAQVAAFRVTSGELVGGLDGTARFTLAAGRLGACPLGYDGGAWSVHPCATLEVGRVTAEGELDLPGRDDGAWVSGGAALWGSLRVLPPLTLTLTAGIAAPFTRYRLRFAEPSRIVYELSGAGGHLGGGLSLSWP